MAIGKYDSIYNKLKEDIEVIKVEQNYNNLSLAFSHWLCCFVLCKTIGKRWLAE